MSDFLTEQDVVTLLIDNAKLNNEVSPRVVIMLRTQKPRSLTRTVRFALIVTADNLDLIDNMIKSTLDYDSVDFIGSEVNLQGDMSIAYLYFEALIIAKINKR